jgi:hypothetical protein
MADPGKATVARTSQSPEGIAFSVDWQISGSADKPATVSGGEGRPGGKAPVDPGVDLGGLNHRPAAGHVGPAPRPGIPGPQSAGASGDRPPGTPVHKPPVGAATRLDMLNVIASALVPASGKSARVGARARGRDDDLRLEVVAWVNNVAYDKEVWMELSVAGSAGDQVQEAAVALQYQAPAGGGGDLFSARVNLLLLAPRHVCPDAALSYRLYYRVHDSVFTDGIVHSHALGQVPQVPGTGRRR